MYSFLLLLVSTLNAQLWISCWFITYCRPHSKTLLQSSLYISFSERKDLKWLQIICNDRQQKPGQNVLSILFLLFFMIPPQSGQELRGSQRSVCPAATNTSGLHIYGLYTYNISFIFILFTVMFMMGMGVWELVVSHVEGWWSHLHLLPSTCHSVIHVVILISLSPSD